MTCARCLKDVEDGSSFCRFCGAPFGSAPRPQRLVRLPDEGRVGGVCAGIAAYFDADVTLVRLAWVVLSIVPGLFLGGVITYVACWILLPIATSGEQPTYHGLRLTRSVRDRHIAGVCGGIAEYLGVDATAVRVVSVILAIYPGAIVCGVIAYLIGWAVIPSQESSMPMDSTPRSAASHP